MITNQNICVEISACASLLIYFVILITVTGRTRLGLRTPSGVVNVVTESSTRSEPSVSLCLMPDNSRLSLLRVTFLIFCLFHESLLFRRSANMNRRPVDMEELITLKVDNISYRTVKDDLEDLFGKYGRIGDIYIPKDA